MQNENDENALPIEFAPAGNTSILFGILLSLELK